jgi:rSAM/selenodomain-associated transferase 1
LTGALVVFAKEPTPGTVKTRLCPPFDPGEAAELYACMLDDVLEHSATLAAQAGLAPFLYVAPPGSVAALAARAPAAFETRPQRGADLGERMDGAVRELGAEGFAPLILRGSDSPALDAPIFSAALAALGEGADVAVSPDPDGGYGLVALRDAHAGLFEHPMSTESVLESTLARAAARSLRCERIRRGFDIDTAEDLVRLRQARAQQAALPCPRTLAFLDERDLWPRV